MSYLTSFKRNRFRGRFETVVVMLGGVGRGVDEEVGEERGDEGVSPIRSEVFEKLRTLCAV